MPKFDDMTILGGVDGRFHTTCWTVIADSHTSDDEKNRLIINDLLGLYWKPVYCYLRRKGNDNETSKDLTQGFFQEIVLGRELIAQADKSKGKFRTFLLTALDNYVIDLYRKESSGKRQPQGAILQLDDIDIPYHDRTLSPQEEFNHAWVSELLDKTLSEVQQECQQTNKQTHWKVFTAKVLTPIVEGTKPPSLTELCRKHGIDTEAQASNMITTVKRRLKKHLERNLRQIVRSDSKIDSEISALLKSLV